MYVIAEIIVNIILILGIYLVQWGFRHKNITLGILAAVLVAVDIAVWFHVFSGR